MATHARDHSSYEPRHALRTVGVFGDGGDAAMTDQISQMCDRMQEEYLPVVYSRPREPMPRAPLLCRPYVPGELVAG